MRLIAYGICALFAAAAGDMLVETLGNARCIGTGVDTHHESLVPTLAVASLMLVVLAIRIARRRLEARDDWVIAFARRCAPVSFCNTLVRTMIVQLAIVTAMESYESLYGGGPPFDAFRDSAASALAAFTVYAACAAVVTVALQRFIAAIGAACDALRASVEIAIAHRATPRYASRRTADDAELIAARIFPPQIFGERAPPRVA